MPQLPIRKRLNIVRLYWQGSSYGEIAQTATVGKGTVSKSLES